MEKRETWGSKIGFMLAVAGSAVGLANIWRFPYIVGENGGAAFILIYLFFLFVIGFPVFLSEMLIGRAAEASPGLAYAKLSERPAWGWAGRLTVLTGFIVSAFYSAIAGWVFGYFVEALLDKITAFQTTGQSRQYFHNLLQTPAWCAAFHFLFIAVCSFILYFGVRRGIERATKVMMPALFFMLAILVAKGVSMPHAEKALAFLFAPDWSALSPNALITALGQAFFTLSLGQGTMVTYGSYLSKKENLFTTSIPIVLIDLLVSLLSAIAVFTIVFSVGMEPNEGPGLLFQTLPWVFSQLQGGYLMAIAFFFLVLLAAITSQVSAMEPAIAYLRDERGLKRHSAVFTVALSAFSLGLPCALSFSTFSQFDLFGLNPLGFLDALCSKILIPTGALLATIFVGWVWKFPHAFKELQTGDNGLFNRYPSLKGYLVLCIRYVSPILILIVFYHTLSQ